MTHLLYLKDTYLFKSTATILEIKTLEDGRTAIILDQTIFYPQGGGQPCDTGIISTNQARFLVKDVRLDASGLVNHIGKFEQALLDPGQQVELEIDQARRILHAKLHSAGHLLDCSITQLGLKVKPSKGYHFADSPYVEYEGNIANSPEMLQAIQEKIDALIAANIPIIIQELSSEQAQQQSIKAPEGKSARIVTFDGFEPCGCGGTHIRNAQEIGYINIRRIKSKGGFSRVSYEIK